MKQEETILPYKVGDLIIVSTDRQGACHGPSTVLQISIRSGRTQVYAQVYFRAINCHCKQNYPGCNGIPIKMDGTAMPNDYNFLLPSNINLKVSNLDRFTDLLEE